MSLARLWQQQGKRAEARELLAPVYGWFTEGFDTADLLDAQTLLSTLATESPRCPSPTPHYPFPEACPPNTCLHARRFRYMRHSYY